MAKFRAFFRKYLLGSDVADSFFESGYVIGEVIACTLRQCGDDLSRENIMRQTLHLDGLGSPVLLPEIKMGTTPTENDPLHQFQLCTFRR
jgi:branched-chain amino acid transport system substrate-binding protein